MKKIIIISIIVIGLLTVINAQGITNTLGGNTADDKFIVENKDGTDGLVVTGEGNVGIGTFDPDALLSVGNDVKNTAIYGESMLTQGRGVSGSASGERGKGVFGLATGVEGSGISGSALGEEGTGVRGYAPGLVGKGVFGQATGDEGKGVSGSASGDKGKGIYGSASGVNAFAGYFNGRGYFRNNVGIGEKDPSDKLHVNSDSGQNALRVQVDGATKLRVFSNGGTAIGANYQSTPSNGLYVHGDIKNSGGVLHTSDQRFKTDIKPIDNSLEKLKNIRGIYYNWNREQYPERDFNINKQIGVIAQEVEKEFPELVDTDNDGYKSVNYSKLTPILIEAIKELHQIVDNQQKRIEELENR
ncbi:MAG: hypothetical protein GWP19_05100 [Planctomycetia bacterium]|nr:hypothetical protein [Planctomycetia bacterium]